MRRLCRRRGGGKAPYRSINEAITRVGDLAPGGEALHQLQRLK